jgi:hypothetical protein
MRVVKKVTKNGVGVFLLPRSLQTPKYINEKNEHTSLLRDESTAYEIKRLNIYLFTIIPETT